MPSGFCSSDRKIPIQKSSFSGSVAAASMTPAPHAAPVGAHALGEVGEKGKSLRASTVEGRGSENEGSSASTLSHDSESLIYAAPPQTPGLLAPSRVRFVTIAPTRGVVSCSPSAMSFGTRFVTRLADSRFCVKPSCSRFASGEVATSAGTPTSILASAVADLKAVGELVPALTPRSNAAPESGLPLTADSPLMSMCATCMSSWAQRIRSLVEGSHEFNFAANCAITMLFSRAMRLRSSLLTASVVGVSALAGGSVTLRFLISGSSFSAPT
mmetsp:Transcript_1483/g.3719  ORF Transcript_1483/g.3719 Transcript_1483/m.3719 type:complete len:271 (+) Transcript_1483:118-930(+)